MAEYLLELYVARRAPRLSPDVKALAPTIFSAAMGIPGVTLPDDPIQSQPTYPAALAAFQALPQVRILFDNGAGGSPGAPLAGFEQSYPSFPRFGPQSSGMNRIWNGRQKSWLIVTGNVGVSTIAKSSASGPPSVTLLRVRSHVPVLQIWICRTWPESRWQAMIPRERACRFRKRTRRALWRICRVGAR